MPCRLVNFFDEGEAVALWVEDGTRCPHYTCSDSNIQPFDSQATQDICNECTRICVRSSKRLFAGLKLEPEMFLYLREVQPTAQNVQAEDNVTVVQFEIRGAVETLPHNTRYHKSLLQKLNKPQVKDSSIQPEPHPNVKISDDQPEPQSNVKLSGGQPEPHPSENSPEKHLIKEVLQPGKDSLKKTSCITIEEHLNVVSEKVSVASADVGAVEGKEVKIVLGKGISFSKLPIVHFLYSLFALVVDHIQSSGESSTDRAIREIPSDFFEVVSPTVPELVREDVEREKRRLHLLIHPETDVFECADVPQSQLLSRPSTESQNIASLEDITFSQVVASTQKPKPISEVDDGASNDGDETSFSQETTSGQRLFSPGTDLELSGLCGAVNESPSDSPIEKNKFKFTRPTHSVSQSRNNSLSPHPKFRASDEILEIKTSCSITADCSSDNENQLNISIDAPLFCTHKTEGDQQIDVDDEVQCIQDHQAELRITGSRNKHKKHSNQVVEKVVLIDDDQFTRKEEIVLTTGKANKTQSNERNATVISSRTMRNRIEDINQGSSQSQAALSSIDESETCSVLAISEEYSQESDKGSIIEIDPLSQDLEDVFCAIERAGPIETYLENLSEIEKIKPGERFRITGRIIGLQPKQSDDELLVDLRNILIAFCFECKHLWQYHHFIDSRSTREYRSRKPPKEPTNCSKKKDEGRVSSAVINYLCSEEEHDRVMQTLTETQFPNFEAFEFDDQIFKDYSYCYVCPLCKRRGIPDVLCKLEPTFFFWAHLTQQENESTSCLHVLASGVHAEYLLGTKADHALRSPIIWKRTEERITKLVTNQKPMTLSLRRNPTPNNEICLEYTYVVYSANHIPWV